MADRVPVASASAFSGRYRLVVFRHRSLSEPPLHHPAERTDLTVSEPVHAWLTRGFTKSEDQRPTWHGGAYTVMDSPLAQMLCDLDPAVQALGEELLPVLRWCVASTALGDVCALVRWTDAS